MKRNSHNLSSRSFINRANVFFGDLLNATYDCIWLVDKKTKLVVYANYACEKRYSYKQDEFIGMPISSLNILGNEVIQREMRHIDKLASEFHAFETVHLLGTKNTINVEVLSKLVNFNGREYYLSRITDITEKIRAQKQVVAGETAVSNEIDCSVTGHGTTLYQFFQEKCENCEFELGQIFIEIDLIGKIVNKFGQQYTTFVEKQINRIIDNFMQKKGYLVHLAEGKFLALLPGYGSEETRQIADWIKMAIEGVYFVNNKQVFTCSVKIRVENRALGLLSQRLSSI